MSRSGCVTLFIGRERRYLSPVSTKCPFAELSNPQKSRIPVPEFPQSKISNGSFMPSELILIVTPSSSIFAPRFFTISKEFRVSSARKKFVISLVPDASIENITDLCEIDLSGAILEIFNKNFSDEKTVTKIHIPSHGCQSNVLINYGGTSFHHTEEWKGEGVDVSCERLDDIYTGVPSFIKIDVEGHELQVLKGATETIKKHKPTILIEIHDFSEDSEIHQYLKSLGYGDPEKRPEAIFIYKTFA